MQLIGQPGVYDLTETAYHSDPVAVPSFSRSIAKILCEASPAHAYCAHPRLGAQPTEDEPEAIEARDVGTAAHAAFLRGESVVVRIEHDSYKSKVAKQARDEALAAGLVPLKRAKHDNMLRMVDRLEAYRSRTGLFTKGKPEQTLIWQEGPTWCRCRVDWLPDDPSEPLLDLKTTAGKASLDAWTRRCFDGPHLQSVFYPRGAAELRDGEVPNGFVYIVIEAFPPFGIKRFELSPLGYDLAQRQIDYAMRTWERCIAENSWPGYDDNSEWADPPPWTLRAWEWSSVSGQRVSLPREDAALADRMIATGNFGG
jgi:hypothetical protein